MKKPVAVRKYNFPDAILKETCNENASNMQRDATQFLTFGVTATTVNTYTADINAFEAMPTDSEPLGDQMIATAAKDAAAEDVRVGIRGVLSRAQNKFGDSSAKYRKFDAEGMSEMDDANLLDCGRRVAHVANGFLTDLATEGLTAAMLTNLNALCQTFETALRVKGDKVGARDIAAEDRIIAGNALYDKLIRFCNDGKTIWETVSEARYNDYVIYNTPSGGPEDGGTTTP